MQMQGSLFEVSHEAGGWRATPAAREAVVVRMTPANPELEIRDAVLARHERKRAAVLRWLRLRMKALYFERLAKQGRELARVTADDARVLLDSDGRFKQLNRNFLGQLFLADGWVWNGEYIRSATAGSHGNLIKCWRWCELAFAEAQHRRAEKGRRKRG